MPRSFVEVEIRAEGPLRENLIGILSQLGFEGFWEDEPALKGYIGADRWTPALADEIRSVVNLVARSSGTPAPQLRIASIEDRNWNEEWEKTIRPIQVSERIAITPTWHTYVPLPGQIVLTIDPKMSFGTGYHETTRLVLRLMERHLRTGATLLDIGTGTGVLAIAAVKLGARSALGIDVDEWSYANALENVKLNGVEEKVQILHGELEIVPATRFDMIVANIQRNVLEPMLPRMKRRLAGLMILSGLLLSDEELVRTSLQIAGFRMIDRLVENEWLALCATAL